MLNSVATRAATTKMAKPMALFRSMTKDSSDGRNQWAIPTMETAVASNPGPRPPSQALTMMAVSGSG